CPGCMRLLREVNVGTFRHNDREVSPDLDVREGTRLGGFDLLTSDAEAHPGTMALALATLGLYAGAGGLALLTLPGELNGYLVLGCANLALAIALFSLPGFARPLVIVSAPIQALAWCWLGREVLPSPAVLGVGLAPLLILAGVSGATGPRRRSLVLAAVLGA